MSQFPNLTVITHPLVQQTINDCMTEAMDVHELLDQALGYCEHLIEETAARIELLGAAGLLAAGCASSAGTGPVTPAPAMRAGSSSTTTPTSSLVAQSSTDGCPCSTSSSSAPPARTVPQPPSSTAAKAMRPHRSRDDCGRDGTIDIIKGEITVMCQAWNGGAWTGGAWTGGAWTGDQRYAGISYGYDDTKYGVPFIEEGQVELTPRRHMVSVKRTSCALNAQVPAQQYVLLRRNSSQSAAQSLARPLLIRGLEELSMSADNKGVPSKVVPFQQPNTGATVLVVDDHDGRPVRSLHLRRQLREERADLDPLLQRLPAGPRRRGQVGGGLVRPLDGLQPHDAAITVEKHRHSALVGTGLAVWLHQHGIRRLIVAGIRTEQCCETTTRHASDEGWEVDYVTEATLTFDMTTPAGETPALPAGGTPTQIGRAHV